MRHILTLNRAIFFILLVNFSFALSAQNRPHPSKPNIVLIFMDDMGYGDVDAYGGIGYTTPNIDKIATQGMRFTNFYAVQPICSASRAGLLTGTYPNRIGFHGALLPHSKIGISDKEETIAGMLKNVGYATGIVGKWHLGDAKKFLPLQHGFDYYFGLPYSNDMWPYDYNGNPVKPGDPAWNAKHNEPPLPLMEGDKPIRYIRTMKDQGMLTTWYTQKAVTFIKRHKDNPFFLYLAHSMVHAPLAVSNKFKGKSKEGLFGDVMMEIDWSVGQVMKTLKENGLAKNTLVIFTSDNGPDHFGNYGGSTGGLRGAKATTWEGGMREPFIVKWPGIVPAGTVSNKLSSTIDLLPTLAYITGAPLPEKKVDGVNIFSLFKGDTNANPRDHLYYYYRRNALEGVRQGRWKLVFPHKYYVFTGAPMKDGFPVAPHHGSTGLALYDLRYDPGEHYDVKKFHPEVVKRLQALGEKAREDMGDALMGRKGENRRTPGRLEKE